MREFDKFCRCDIRLKTDFAFVEFRNECEAEAAIAVINVKLWAALRSKPSRASSQQSTGLTIQAG